MDRLLQDLRLAVRSLSQSRGTAVVIGLSIALAIAGNATVFSIIEAALFRPFPYPDVERLTVLLESRRQVPDDESLVSAANLIDWRERTRSFSSLEAFCPWTLTLAGGDRPEEIAAVVATPGLLPLLGTQVERGRGFEPAEGTPGGSGVVILTHALWRRRFGADPKILGTTIRLDDRPHTVIGILPENFDFISPNIQAWVPLVLDRATAARDRRDLIAMARLSPGVTVEAARRDLEAVAGRLASEHPAENRGYTAQVKTLRQQFPAKSDRQLYELLQIAMLLVLLVACANVANVLLARGQDRQAEIAVRTALGAGRRRIVRQLLTESLLLAGTGGLLGLLLARGAIVLLTRLFADQLPAHYIPAVDARVVLFGLATSLGAGLLFGLAPALAASSPNLAAVLGEGSRTATAGKRRRWVAHGLVVVELALALTMLSGTALLLKGMIDLRTLSPGFDPERLLTFRLSPPATRYSGPGELAGFENRVIERLSALPGVAAATATSILPRSREANERPVTVEGAEGAPSSPGVGGAHGSWQPPPASATVISVPPGYFAALGVALLAGRDLSPFDRPGGEPVALLGHETARRFFPSLALGEVLGRRLSIAGHSVRVVGVAGDIQQGRLLDRGGVPPTIYLPFAQAAEPRMHFLVRTKGDPVALAETVRSAIREIDADLAVADVQTYREHVERQFQGERVIVALMGAFALVALLLAAVGVYGMISYSIIRRTRELGIRMVLGADRRRVVLLVAKRGFSLTALGLIAGAPGVWLAYRTLAGLLPGAVPFSNATIPAVVVALSVVAAFASVEPANRAASVDPTIVLRG
jgi:putative ABC transport system permease protein